MRWSIVQKSRKATFSADLALRFSRLSRTRIAEQGLTDPLTIIIYPGKYTGYIRVEKV